MVRGDTGDPKDSPQQQNATDSTAVLPSLLSRIPPHETRVNTAGFPLLAEKSRQPPALSPSRRSQRPSGDQVIQSKWAAPETKIRLRLPVAGSTRNSSC